MPNGTHLFPNGLTVSCTLRWTDFLPRATSIFFSLQLTHSLAFPRPGRVSFFNSFPFTNSFPFPFPYHHLGETPS